MKGTGKEKEFYFVYHVLYEQKMLIVTRYSSKFYVVQRVYV